MPEEAKGSTREMALRSHDLALGELANGHPAAALRALKQAVALDPQLASAHCHLGLALQELGRLDEAEAGYREALRIDPSHAGAYLNLGKLLQQRGHHQQARQCFVSALGIQPALNQARLDLADTLVKLGELEEAAGCYREAIAASSAPEAIYTQLGAVLWKLGRSREALEAFERSVDASPAAAAAHYNLGSVQLESGRFDAAVRSAREALRLQPGFSEAAILCAASLAATGALETGFEVLQESDVAGQTAAGRYLTVAMRLLGARLFEPARLCLERVLREQSGEVMACHLLAALSGANPAHPTQGYVRQLFDASAASFDRELVAKLGYGIPREMVAALRELEGAPESPWDILDLGCGTGLVGLEIAPYSRRLVGIDLAPKMIERARDRKLYTELRCADLLAALAEQQEQQRQYDVVTAADVFIYVGKLDAVIAAIRRVLRPGGLLAFSAEALEAAVRIEGTVATGAGEGVAPEGCRLGVMGRYAHGRDYIRRLAAQNAFEVRLLRQARIRFEHRRPVQGWLTLWRASL